MIFLRDRIRLSKLPLQWVLTIPLVVQTLGIVGLVGYLSYASGQRSIQKLAYQLMANVEQQVSRELDGYLQSPHEFNQQQAAAMQAGVITPQDLDQLHRHLILQHRQAENLTTLLMGTPAGDFRVSHRISPRDYESNTYLRSDELPYEVSLSNSDEPSTLYVHAVNAAGKPARYLQKLEKIDVRDRPWYRQAVETGQAGWTAPFQIGSTDVLALNAYAPLYDDANQLLGVFAVNISLEQLSQFLETLDIGVSGEAFIIDLDGLLIAESTPELPYGISGQVGGASDGTTEPGLLTFERRSPADMPNALLQQSYQHLRKIYGDFSTLQSLQQMEFMAQGKRYFLTISPYSDEYGLDWLVATVVPASDFMGEIQQSNRTTAWLCLLALGGAIASGTVLSKKIARRFENLNQASRALAQGDFEQTLPTDSAIAEVQGLATAFNQVAAQLQRSFQQQVEIEATRQSEARFQELAAMLPGSICMYTRRADGSHQVDYFNPICRDMLGLDPADVMADADLAFNRIHPEDRPLCDQILDQSAETLAAFTLAFRYIPPSGQVKWLEASCQPQRYTDGRITWYGILLDVSDRQAAKVALQKSETRFQTVVDHFPDVFVIYDRDRRIQYVNERGLAMTGWPLQKFLGKRDEELFPPSVTAAYLPILQRAVETRSLQQGEATIHFPDQPPYTIWVKYAPILDQQGEIQQILAMTIDISKRKQMEADLRSLNAQLQELATVDSLTQVANRRQMELHLQQEWERCRRAQVPLTLVLLDIDHFKRYNDHYGHPQGDACLRQVADILHSHVNRPSDLVSRYGGEEFLIVLPHTEQPGAIHLVNAIRQSLAQAQIFHAASPTAEIVTVSMGVAVVTDVTRYSSPTEAIAATDELLYQAKQIRDTYYLRVI